MATSILHRDVMVRIANLLSKETASPAVQALKEGLRMDAVTCANTSIEAGGTRLHGLRSVVSVSFGIMDDAELLRHFQASLLLVRATMLSTRRQLWLPLGAGEPWVGVVDQMPEQIRGDPTHSQMAETTSTGYQFQKCGPPSDSGVPIQRSQMSDQNWRAFCFHTIGCSPESRIVLVPQPNPDPFQFALCKADEGIADRWLMRRPDGLYSLLPRAKTLLRELYAARVKFLHPAADVWPTRRGWSPEPPVSKPKPSGMKPAGKGKAQSVRNTPKTGVNSDRRGRGGKQPEGEGRAVKSAPRPKDPLGKVNPLGLRPLNPHGTAAKRGDPLRAVAALAKGVIKKIHQMVRMASRRTSTTVTTRRSRRLTGAARRVAARRKRQRT